jgi:F0F1-type ATP synthase delta subunit
MKQPSTKIARYLADDTLKNGKTKKLSREIAAYLLTEKRLNDLDSILRDTQQYWADSGYVEVDAVSAYPISAKVEKDIKTKIKKLYPNAKTIKIDHDRDENVIAGVRLELANQQLDLSVETKLNKFKQLSVS